jgi:hypothetical protein
MGFTIESPDDGDDKEDTDFDDEFDDY